MLMVKSSKNQKKTELDNFMSSFMNINYENVGAVICSKDGSGF